MPRYRTSWTVTGPAQDSRGRPVTRVVESGVVNGSDREQAVRDQLNAKFGAEFSIEVQTEIDDSIYFRHADGQG